MSQEILFSAIHIPIFPAWALLALAPVHRITRLYVHSALIFLLLGVLYTSLLGMGILGASNEGAGFGSLQSVMIMFSHPIGALNSWVHFLLFDLFVGAWIARDAHRRGIGRLTVFPCLFFTFLFGPLGLALYLLLRPLLGHKTWSLME